LRQQELFLGKRTTTFEVGLQWWPAVLPAGFGITIDG